MSTMEEWALAYADLGLPVVPTHNKRPLIKGGVNAASTDPKKIRARWRQFPNADIAVATGSISRVIVIDVDPRNGGLESMAQLEEELGPLPKTAKVITGGGGYHLYFRLPVCPIKSDTAGKTLGPGVDILADGRLATVPPSGHESGKRYYHVKGRNMLKGAEVMPLPKLWRDHIKKGQKKTTVQAVVVRDGSGQQKIPEGLRNASLISLGGTLARKGCGFETIHQALQAENKSRCEPPLSDDEVRKIATSAASYQVDASVLDANDPAMSIMKMVLQSHYADGNHLICADGAGFYQYTGKYWKSAPHSTVETVVLDTIQTIQSDMRPKTVQLLREVVRLLEVDRARDAAKLDLIGAFDRPSVINCANCEVWLDADGNIEARPHSPTSYLTNLIDVPYLPDATCQAYDKAVLGTFQEAKHPKAMRRNWNELFGYILQPRRNIALIVLLLGGGSNGKTRLMGLVKHLLGTENYVSTQTARLEGNQFSLSMLIGKLLFYDDDVNSGTKLPDGILKTISEEQTITTERKYKDSFSYINRAVPVLLCNNLPTTSDVSRGLRRRIMAIPFDHEFVPGVDLDDGLFDRIMKNELSGVLNRALAGLQRLRARGGFKKPVDIIEATESWFKAANPIKGFLSECCEDHPDGRWLQREMYATFKVWAKDSGYTYPTQLKTFSEKLRQLGYEIRHTNQGMMVFGLRQKSDETFEG